MIDPKELRRVLGHFATGVTIITTRDAGGNAYGLTANAFPPTAIGHGTDDPVISVDWGRQARDRLEQAGADVLYRESPMAHTIDPRFANELAGVVSAALP